MGDDDWDLQAVVRGCTGHAAATAAGDPFSSFPGFACLKEERVKEEEGELLFCFPDLFSTKTAMQELEELCKPFFPRSPQHKQKEEEDQKPLVSSLRSPCSSTSPVSLPLAGAAAVQPLLQQQQPRQLQPRSLSHTLRSKRRKNQQKRVVCQVPADGLSSDMWAWRKYGQKPIKGSPYPRGYYRCSSSKGCLARKQVERSKTDPGTFIITYTAEHNHPLPTHRNSLAGSTRQKFPPPSSTSSSDQQVNVPGLHSASGAGAGDQDQPPKTSSPLSSAGLSPTTPLTALMEEEDSLMVEDIEMVGDDDMLFMGLDDLVGPGPANFSDGFADQFSASSAFSAHWTANNTATAARGS